MLQITCQGREATATLKETEIVDDKPWFKYEIKFKPYPLYDGDSTVKGYEIHTDGDKVYGHGKE